MLNIYPTPQTSPFLKSPILAIQNRTERLNTADYSSLLKAGNLFWTMLVYTL